MAQYDDEDESRFGLGFLNVAAQLSLRRESSKKIEQKSEILEDMSIRSRHLICKFCPKNSPNKAVETCNYYEEGLGPWNFFSFYGCEQKFCQMHGFTPNYGLMKKWHPLRSHQKNVDEKHLRE